LGDIHIQFRIFEDRFIEKTAHSSKIWSNFKKQYIRQLQAKERGKIVQKTAIFFECVFPTIFNEKARKNLTGELYFVERINGQIMVKEFFFSPGNGNIENRDLIIISYFNPKDVIRKPTTMIEKKEKKKNRINRITIETLSCIGPFVKW
jgi:hypothetical protein